MHQKGYWVFKKQDLAEWISLIFANASAAIILREIGIMLRPFNFELVSKIQLTELYFKINKLNMSIILNFNPKRKLMTAVANMALCPKRFGCAEV